MKNCRALFFLFLTLLFSSSSLEAWQFLKKRNPTATPEAQLDEGPEVSQEVLLCDEGAEVYTVGARYIQGSGVGYHRGYTTVEGFFALPRRQNSWNPFLDLRGHIFNNRDLAANCGLGVRYIDSVAWGANAYYDYRQTSHFHYNQVGAGLEAIGSFWKVSVNGYLPVGRKKTSLFDASIAGPPPNFSFAFFQGNQFFITLMGTEALTAKREFALKGIDASAAFRLGRKEGFTADVEVGPYYFNGYYQKQAIGGKGSLTIRWNEIFTIGAIASYDTLFHKRIQGTFGFSIPLGPKSFFRSSSESRTCPPSSFYDASLARGADRFEIVVVDRHEKILASASSGETFVAINPNTGLPYLVWFVNNTSSSNGTFESPYNNLASAETASGPNDIIYVYAGDGTSTGMDAGIALKDGQQLIGAGTSVTIQTQSGPVFIPAQSSGMPLIENGGSSIVTLGSGNVLSGLHLGSGATAVSGSAVDGLQVLSCIMDGSQECIDLSGFTGSLTISENAFSNYTDQAFLFSSSSGTNGVSITGNSFASQMGAPNSFGILGTLTNTSETSFAISSNTFTEHTNTSIQISSLDTTIMNPTIAENMITAPAIGANTVAVQLNPGGASSTATLTGNTMIGHQGNTVNANADGSVAYSITASNNVIQGTDGMSLKGIALTTTNSSSAVWSATVENNTLTGGFTQADIYLDPQGTSMLTAMIANNSSTGDGTSGAIGIEIDTDNSATVVSSTIVNNVCQNHLSSEMVFSSRGVASSATFTVSGNQLTGIMGGGSGIQMSTSNGGSLTATVSGNTLTDIYTDGISLNSSDTSNINADIASNQLTAPDGVSNTQGISVFSSDTSILNASIARNALNNHTGFTIASHFDGSSGSLAIQRNAIVGVPGVSLKAMGLDTGTSTSTMWQVDIENNGCSGGFTQADIYIDPRGTSNLTSAIVNNNTTIGDSGGTSANGIQMDVDDTATVALFQFTNNQCSNHTSAEISVAGRGTGNSIAGEISNNTCNSLGGSAIQASIDNSGTMAVNISENSVFAPGDPVSANGITASSTNNSNLNSAISGNQCVGFEAFSIQLNHAGNSANCVIQDNIVVTGNSIGDAFGILMNSTGETQNIAISGNQVSTPTGGSGSQFGIVAAQMSANMPTALQSVSITGNTATNCGNAASAFGFTAGIIAAVENTDNFFVDMENNTATDCGVSSLGGMAAARIAGPGAPGQMCWKLVNCTSNTDFTLYNLGGMASDFTLDASGNTGMIIPVGPFTTGTCP